MEIAAKRAEILKEQVRALVAQNTTLDQQEALAVAEAQERIANARTADLQVSTRNLVALQAELNVQRKKFELLQKQRV